MFNFRKKYEGDCFYFDFGNGENGLLCILCIKFFIYEKGDVFLKFLLSFGFN